MPFGVNDDNFPPPPSVQDDVPETHDLGTDEIVNEYVMNMTQHDPLQHHGFDPIASIPNDFLHIDPVESTAPITLNIAPGQSLLRPSLLLTSAFDAETSFPVTNTPAPLSSRDVTSSRRDDFVVFRADDNDVSPAFTPFDHLLDTLDSTEYSIEGVATSSKSSHTDVTLSPTHVASSPSDVTSADSETSTGSTSQVRSSRKGKKTKEKR